MALIEIDALPFLKMAGFSQSQMVILEPDSNGTDRIYFGSIFGRPSSKLAYDSNS
jgi:hypothetical protein